MAEGLLDDRLLAKLWIDDRLLYRPLSRRAIALELKDKGIASGIIEPLLAEAYPPEREQRIALELAVERYERLDPSTPERRARRTVDYLARKGFSRSLAIDIVRGLEVESGD